MRIAITFPYSIRRVTGIGAVVQAISRGLRAEGHSVAWVVPGGTAGVFFPPPEGAAVDEVRIDRYLRGRDVVLALGTLRALWRMSDDLDLIHAHQPHLQTVAAALVARIRGIPIVVTLHGRLPRPDSRLPKAFLRLLERAVFRWSNRVVLVSDASKAEFEDPRGIVIHNGVRVDPSSLDAEMRRRIRSEWAADDGPVLIYSGRFAVLKGVHELLEAVRDLRAAGRRFRLVLIGGGLPEEEAQTNAKLRELGLEEATIVYGAIQDYLPYLGCADIYVFPSHLEGLPLTVLEAMAAGLPVVATNVGGIPEVVRDGTEGRLVPPRDPRALKDAIAWMLDHPVERARMGKAARERVTLAFSEGRMVSDYMRLYRDLLPASPKP